MSNKSESRMQQHGSKYFAFRPPPQTLGIELVGQNSTFSQHSHVAYQIKEKHEWSYMVANILPADPFPDPGDGVNRSNLNLFIIWSCCISNECESRNAAAWKQIFCRRPN